MQPRVAVLAPGAPRGDDDPLVPYWRDWLRGLDGRAQIEVFPLRLPDSGPPYRLAGALVRPLGVGDPRLRDSPRLWRAALRALRAAHRARPFDLIQAWHAGEAGMLAVLAGRRLGLPVVAHLAGGELARLPDIGYGGALLPFERAALALTLAGAQRVTVGSERLAVALRARMGRREGRVRVLPLGVAEDVYRIPPREVHRGGEAAGAPTAPTAPRLVCVARLRPVKDPAGLLRAFAGLETLVASRRPPLLELVGGGPELDGLLRLRRELGLERRVVLRGWLPRAALPLVLASADACVCASRHEAQGLALLEAAAAGLPVASTEVGVAGELSPDATFLAPPGNPEALRAAMARALALSADAERAEPARRAQRARARRWALARTSRAQLRLWESLSRRPRERVPARPHRPATLEGGR